MPVRVVFRPLSGMQGFAFDTPDGVTLVFDVELDAGEQRRIAQELLDDGEAAEILASLTAA